MPRGSAVGRFFLRYAPQGSKAKTNLLIYHQQKSKRPLFDLNGRAKAIASAVSICKKKPENPAQRSAWEATVTEFAGMLMRAEVLVSTHVTDLSEMRLGSLQSAYSLLQDLDFITWKIKEADDTLTWDKLVSQAAEAKLAGVDARNGTELKDSVAHLRQTRKDYKAHCDEWKLEMEDGDLWLLSETLLNEAMITVCELTVIEYFVFGKSVEACRGKLGRCREGGGAGKAEGGGSWERQRGWTRSVGDGVKPQLASAMRSNAGFIWPVPRQARAGSPGTRPNPTRHPLPRCLPRLRSRFSLFVQAALPPSPTYPSPRRPLVHWMVALRSSALPFGPEGWLLADRGFPPSVGWASLQPEIVRALRPRERAARRIRRSHKKAWKELKNDIKEHQEITGISMKKLINAKLQEMAK